MAHLTTTELLREMGAVMSPSDARSLLKRAARVAGVRHRGSLETSEMLRVLESLASEGGRVQVVAEEMARRALHVPPEQRYRKSA